VDVALSSQEDEDPTRRWPDDEGLLRIDPHHDSEHALIVDVRGFEGPLDLLLELARQHRVDLSQISILALAEQYLSFIETARKLQLELAADYLVMAAWLAYLKSRLLLPVSADNEETSAEDMTARLAFRLQRLQAMREASARLMARDQLGRDVFARGIREPLLVESKREYADNLIDLLRVYAERRQRNLRKQSYTVQKLPIFSIKEARAALERMIGTIDDWSGFDQWLADFPEDPKMWRSVKASSFTASLELAREGLIEMRQDHHHAPLYMRRRLPSQRRPEI
jgi:segregation and condensation protein A